MLTCLRAPVRTVIGSLFGAAVAIAMATASSAARAAPSNADFVVAETPLCRVVLVAASYDDPGADDAEFVELRVDSFGDGGGICTIADAGDTVDAGPADAAGPTLADCGLGALELVDGASGGCATYRAIPLGSVAIPMDGYVVLCPAGSTVDARAHCDVTAAGRSALRAGWLQNGPDDGLRFVDAQGHPTLEVGYEGSPSCFGSSAAPLAAETGGTAESDDVNVACAGAFTLLAEEEAPLRKAIPCPGKGAGDGGSTVTDGGEGGVVRGIVPPRTDSVEDAGTDAVPWAPEHAPAPPKRPPMAGYGSYYVDAALPGLKRPDLPRPPACTMGQRGSPLGVVPLLAAITVLVLRKRRQLEGLVALTLRKRPTPSAARPALRGRCGVRCGSARRRSPSR